MADAGTQITLGFQTCSCSYFMKNYFCYHLIALAVNEKMLEIPLEYKNIAIGAKPKRGRKKKRL